MNFSKNLLVRLAAVLLICLLSVAGGTTAEAQNLNQNNLTKSPYSRYGYGKLGSMGNAVTHSMGDVGIAVRSNRFTSLANPASLTAIDTLTMMFSTGLDAQYSTLQEGDLSEHGWDAGFSYMTFHFPLWRNMAMSLSLSPYSKVGYSYGSTQKIPVHSPTVKNDTLTSASTYEGVGGINNFMMGVGWRFLQQKMQEASVGVNVGYLFGTIRHDVSLATSSQSNGTYVSHELTARGLMLGLGLQYSRRFSATQGITLGATFQPQLNLDVDTEELKFSTDTIRYDGRYRGDIKTPMSYGVGVTYELARQLLVSAEFEQTMWSKVEGFDAELKPVKGVYDDVTRFAVGLEYQPKTFARNYLQTCRYRLGFSTQNSYVRVKESTMRDYSVNAGMSLPVNRRSSIDFGVGYTRLQPSDSKMIKENYLTFSLGITFNELMFFRNKLR